MSKNSFESPKSASPNPKPVPNNTPISEIPQIAEGGVAVRYREDLIRLVEVPLLDACQSLYDINKNATQSQLTGS